ncbi:hypothetical protein [Zobellella sp. DQSA1]|uniref:hypothetical protein n=1 Tax=Zobellella sp. DQSA1 TaxID=3342386 RepID=UPI0035C0CE54
MKVLTLMKESALGFGGVEFATFRLREGVEERTLLEASEQVDREFLAHEEGLLGHVLLRGRDGIYADLAFADSQARAEAVCAKWTANAVALQYIELLDEQSVEMTFWERIR